jgi:acetoin utilization protein AcuB
MSTPVKEFMTHMPHTIGHDISVEKAIDMMKQYSCHHLPVLDGGKLVGIVSDRDIQTLSKLAKFDNVKAEDIMTDEPVVVPPELDVFQVAMLMHEKKIGSVIVSAQDNEPWGIFTSTDALAYFTKK